VTKEEQFVREHWEWAVVAPAVPFSGLKQDEFELMLPGFKWPVGFKSPDEAWSRAAEFTLERLEQIRQVEEEIEWLCQIQFGYTCLQDLENRSKAQKRILAIEQARLVELKRGMKADAMDRGEA
jgi:hypothetical protein